MSVCLCLCVCVCVCVSVCLCVCVQCEAANEFLYVLMLMVKRYCNKEYSHINV